MDSDQLPWRGLTERVLGYILLGTIVFVTMFVIPYLLFVA